MQWLPGLQFQVANKAKYQTPSAISQKNGQPVSPKKKRGPLTQLHLDTPFLGGQLLQPSRLLYLWIGLIGLMITLHMVI